MKTKILTVVLIGMSFGLNAQNKIESTGNVGVGTTNPLLSLHIKNPAGGAAFGIERGDKLWRFDIQHNGDKLFLSNSSNANQSFTFAKEGRFGIGTTSPKENLHLEGNLLIDAFGKGNESGIFFRENFNSSNKYNLSILAYDHSGAHPDGLSLNAYDGISFSTGSNNRNERMRISANGNVGIGISSASSKIHINSTSSSAIRVTRNGSNNFGYEIGGSTFGLYDYTNSQYRWRTGNGNVFLVESSGSVGIGTVTMGSHRLAVEGSIGAREIKVEANGWSDFVFYDDYKLPSLLEVEKHIIEKGHLKDIPSAEEVKKDGFFLGEMDSKLLQKIEELTLYTIEQEKKIKKQSIEIEVLNSLAERLTKIEEQLKKKN